MHINWICVSATFNVSDLGPYEGTGVEGDASDKEYFQAGEDDDGASKLDPIELV